MIRRAVGASDAESHAAAKTTTGAMIQTSSTDKASQALRRKRAASLCRGVCVGMARLATSACRRGDRFRQQHPRLGTQAGEGDCRLRRTLSARSGRFSGG